MSCLQPKTMHNPIRSYLFGIDKPSVTFPCRKCEGCLSDMRNDWWIRARQEIVDTINKGGRVFCPVLTYSDRTLPKHFYKDAQGRWQYFPCFNHADVRNYLKKVRKYFERRGIVGGLRYIVCSEYGEREDCTHRSHYHVHFHFNDRYNQFTDEELINVIKKYWLFGIVDGNPELGLKVNPQFVEEASGYVSKYTTKSPEWYDQPQLKKFLDLRGWCLLKDKKIKDILPKRFNSQHFGEGMVDEVMQALTNQRYNHLLEGVELLMKDGKTKTFKLPRYIFDKVMFIKDKESGFKQLSDVGIEVKKNILQNQIEESANRFKLKSLEFNLKQQYRDSEIVGMLPEEYPQDITHLVQYINKLMNGRTWKQLATYATCYRDHNYYDEEYDLVQQYFNNEYKLINYSLRLVKNRNLASIDDRLSQEYDEENSYLNTLSESSRNYILSRTFNNIPCFKDFDEVLSIFQKLNNIKSKRNLKVQKQKDKIKSELKDAFRVKQTQNNKHSRSTLTKLLKNI